MSRIVRLAGGALGGFTPARHGSALKLWRKADAGITLDVSPDILSWADQVAGGDAATVPGNSKPEIAAARQNGLDAARFSLLQQTAFRANDNAIDNFWSGAGDKMIVAAGEWNDTAANGRFFEKGYNNPGAGWMLRSENGSSSGPFRVVLSVRFSGTDCIVKTPDSIDHGPLLIVIVWDGTAADPTHFRVNGADEFDSRTGPTGTVDADASTQLTTGNDDNLTTNLRGYLYEYYFVKPAPTSIAADEAYMNGKWALF